MLRFNDNNEVITEESYRAITVGIETDKDITYSMEELKGLAEAADIEVEGVVIQRMEKPNTATLIGKGKVEEVRELSANMDVDLVIFNDELTGMQLRNLEDAFGVRVIDRTILILDIFAARAESREGKLQVELAQLKYRLPRLTGFGKSLSRLGGGIGTRGPGEKKLETDRRHIEKRIDDIRKELKEAKQVRSVQRSKREKSSIPVVALVGYTNSGKSALMNRLLEYTETGNKSVKEKDMLFATLDTQHRRIQLEKGKEFVLIDTVGFVSSLPHSLVEAFKSTLEEVTAADLLLHVVDASYPDNDFHIEVTDSVLKEIGAGSIEKIMVFNKIDKGSTFVHHEPGTDEVYISAKYGDHIDELVEKIRSHIFGNMVKVKLIIPYTRGDLSSYVCEKGKVISMEYLEEGTCFEVELKEEDFRRLKEYVTL